MGQPEFLTGLAKPRLNYRSIYRGNGPDFNLAAQKRSEHGYLFCVSGVDKAKQGSPDIPFARHPSPITVTQSRDIGMYWFPTLPPQQHTERMGLSKIAMLITSWVALWRLRPKRYAESVSWLPE